MGSVLRRLLSSLALYSTPRKRMVEETGRNTQTRTHTRTLPALAQCHAKINARSLGRHVVVGRGKHLNVMIRV